MNIPHELILAYIKESIEQANKVLELLESIENKDQSIDLSKFEILRRPSNLSHIWLKYKDVSYYFYAAINGGLLIHSQEYSSRRDHYTSESISFNEVCCIVKEQLREYKYFCSLINKDTIYNTCTIEYIQSTVLSDYEYMDMYLEIKKGADSIDVGFSYDESTRI